MQIHDVVGLLLEDLRLDAGVLPQQVLHEDDLRLLGRRLGGLRGLGSVPGVLQLLDLRTHRHAHLVDLQGVDIPEHVEENHDKRRDQVPGAIRTEVLAAHQGERAEEHPDAVEDVVEPAAEDSAVALQAGQLSVDAVEDEADVVEPAPMINDWVSPRRKNPAEPRPTNRAPQVTPLGVMNPKRAIRMSTRVATGSTRSTVHQASRFLHVSFWTARRDSFLFLITPQPWTTSNTAPTA